MSTSLSNVFTSFRLISPSLRTLCHFYTHSFVWREFARPYPFIYFLFNFYFDHVSYCHVGTTKIPNLKENIGSAFVKLTPDEVDEIAAAVPQHEVAGTRMNVKICLVMTLRALSALSTINQCRDKKDKDPALMVWSRPSTRTTKSWKAGVSAKVLEPKRYTALSFPVTNDCERCPFFLFLIFLGTSEKLSSHLSSSGHSKRVGTIFFVPL